MLMAFLHEALFCSLLRFHSSFSSPFRCALPVTSILSSPPSSSCAIKSTQFLKRRSITKGTDFSLSRRGSVCRASEFKFLDPIPEFAEAETEKFRDHMTKKLSKRDLFEDSFDEIVGICTEISGTFLRNVYGGPGTLLVIPFIDMADTLNERGLPGGPQAARAAIKWAQDHVKMYGQDGAALVLKVRTKLRSSSEESSEEQKKVRSIKGRFSGRMDQRKNWGISNRQK